MIHGKKVLALIPARGGSKGLPRKNVLLLGGRPLLAWSILAARGSAHVDRIVVSSEDREIIETAREWGAEVPFVRPAELARDETSGMDVVLHALDQAGQGFDYVVLVQPTSPLRTPQDIDACLERCLETGAPACVSVCEPAKSPHWMYTLRIRTAGCGPFWAAGSMSPAARTCPGSTPSTGRSTRPGQTGSRNPATS